MKKRNTKRYTGIVPLTATVLTLVLMFACFTTACQPVVANAAAEIAVNASSTTAAA